MIVTCESCGTKFRLDEERIKKPSTKVRCSHCGHIFLIEKEAGDEETITGFEMPAGHNLDEETEAGPYSPPHANVAAPRQKKGLAAKLLVLCGLILVLAGGSYWLLQSGMLTPLLQRSQPIRPPNPEDQMSQVKIQKEIQSFFLENDHAGQIFVVQGEVVNESSRAISFVLVEGKLYTDNNEVARSQRCYGGNLIPREDLQRLGMTEIQDIMMNREGNELSNVQVKPQGRIPFMVVFHNLPELDLLKDYSVEVVSADFES